MKRPTRVEHFRWLGDKRNQRVYDLDEVSDESVIDELVRRSQESNLGLEVIDIVCVTDLANQYMKGIGAIGDQITELEGE